MTQAYEAEGGDEPIGPGTDLVISLFCTFLALAVLGAAFNMQLDRLLRASQKKDAPEAAPKGQVVVLDPVRDGLQYFPRQGHTVNPALKDVIVAKLAPLRDNLKDGRGGLIVHITGHASPEPYGYDDGGSNFELALNRAMSIARLLHEALQVPFECLRVHGAGRAESAALGAWLRDHPTQGPAAWDEQYRVERDAEKRNWLDGEADWRAHYSEGKTHLGKELGVERKVVLHTEIADNPICSRAFRGELQASGVP